MVPKRFVSWLTINRDCNLRCEWCYAKQTGFGGSMSLAIVGKALNILKGLPLTNVILIGGEPTVHPDFITIIRMVKEAGFKPLLVTNSLCFKDRSFTDQVFEAGVKGISTSIKAFSNESYERYTGVPAFNDVMQAIGNIENAKPEGVYHKVSVTICKHLFGGFDEMLKALAGSGASLVSFDLERPIILDGKAIFDGFATPQMMADFLVDNYPRMMAMGIRFNIKVGIPFCLFPQDFIDLLIARNQIISGCQIFDGQGIIFDEAGKILPCNHFCNNALGSIDECPTAEAYLQWRERKDVQAFYAKISGYPDRRCIECAQWKFCGGGCRVHWLHRGAKEMLPTSRKEDPSHVCSRTPRRPL